MICSLNNIFLLSLLLRSPLPYQSDVWEADLWDSEQLSAPVPGEPVRLLPDAGACVLCYGVHSWRRPHDAHPRRCIHRATGRVSKVCVLIHIARASDGFGVEVHHETCVCSQVLCRLCGARASVFTRQQDCISVRNLSVMCASFFLSCPALSV